MTIIFCIPFKFIFRTYYPEGMGCGIEDCGITDRYEACKYGWDKAIEAVVEAITNMI